MIRFLRGQGVDDKTISVIVILTACFLFVLGLSVVGLLVYDTVVGVAPAPWLTAAMGVLGSFAITLITGHTTTTSINGTASQTASQTTTSVVSALVNSSMTQQNTSMLQATQENTAATQQNTEATNRDIDKRGG